MEEVEEAEILEIKWSRGRSFGSVGISNSDLHIGHFIGGWRPIGNGGKENGSEMRGEERKREEKRGKERKREEKRGKERKREEKRGKEEVT